MEPTTTPGTSDDRYARALRFRSLTSFYDPFVRWTTREAEFKRRLLDQAGLEAGQRILDLGSGTGTLLLMAHEREPGLGLDGLDGDPEMVEQARAKAERSRVQARFEIWMSDALPYDDGSFDRVLSTLFFHHLTTEDKRRTLDQVVRVLRPGGELHVADWGRGPDPVMRALFMSIRLLDGLERTGANARGELPAMFEDAGLTDAAETDRLRTGFGTMSLYRAHRPRR